MSDATKYADHLGAQAASTLDSTTRKEFGVFLTPAPITHHMAARLACDAATVRILDPSAGSGVLACAANKHFVRTSNGAIRIHIVAFEVIPATHERLFQALGNAQSWAAQHGAVATVDAYCEDYIAQ